MPDPRIKKLAEILVNYSLEIKPGDQFQIRTTPLAQELALAVFEEAVKAGAHVLTTMNLPGSEELFYKLANDDQLEFVSPVRKLIVDSFDAILAIGADYNTRALSGVDPQRLSINRKANTPITKVFFERSAKLELRWCYTEYPTYSSAQEADMSLLDYQEFVYGAGFLNEPDPIEEWKKEEKRQKELIDWLAGKEFVEINGENIEMIFSIKGRRFKESAGKNNFPSGEIFTGPVEDSANGWVRFSYPAIYEGQEVIDVQLEFEKGKVVAEKAEKGEQLLTTLLNTDPGARYLGEWGIGTNYGIKQFTKNILFDEKIGGTIHFALGSGYPETGSENESAIHWDMLCDMSQSEIKIDGEPFYRNGKFLI